jgi:2-aminoadipate transaminase
MTDSEAGKTRLRICFAHASEEIMREGIATLADLCRREFGVPRVDDRTHR